MHVFPAQNTWICAYVLLWPNVKKNYQKYPVAYWNFSAPRLKLLPPTGLQIPPRVLRDPLGHQTVRRPSFLFSAAPLTWERNAEDGADPRGERGRKSRDGFFWPRSCEGGREGGREGCSFSIVVRRREEEVHSNVESECESAFQYCHFQRLSSHLRCIMDLFDFAVIDTTLKRQLKWIAGKNIYMNNGWCFFLEIR